MRTLLLRSLQGVIALVTVALLTGANDAGCGLGTVINGGTGGGQSTTGTGADPGDPAPPIACPDGMVVQLVCDPASPTGGDGGVIAVNECTGPNCPPPPPPPPPCDPSDANCVPPTAGDAGAPPPCDPDDANCSSPPPPPQCDPADPNCPPSFPPPGCSFQCAPADQVCPPGTDAVTVCTSSGGGEGDSGPGGAQPGTIPPGDANTPVSNVMCWTECAPHGCGGETPAEPPIPD